MSTLTKILIFLLSFFSIFLCGTVITYVVTAKNYKAAYEDAKSELAALKQKNQSYEQQLEEKKRQMEELADKLDKEMTQLKTEKSKLDQEVKNAKTARLELEEKVQNLTAAALKFEETVGSMEGSLKQTRQELDAARAEEIKLTKNLNEITASLEQKMAQLESVEAEKKRLLEEKTKLEQQISGGGSTTVYVEPITPLPDSAQPAVETPASVTLQGIVTAVEGSLVTLSIGTADGVQQGMIFHVIRNDSFICDVRMTDVDTEASAGVIQLLQQRPNVGDIASTTW